MIFLQLTLNLKEFFIYFMNFTLRLTTDLQYQNKLIRTNLENTIDPNFGGFHIYIITLIIIRKELQLMERNNEKVIEPVLIGADEVAKILGVKMCSAYKVIRTLNSQLEAQGKITIRGKINRNYLLKMVNPSEAC